MAFSKRRAQVTETKTGAGIDAEWLASLVKDAAAEATADLRRELGDLRERIDRQADATPRFVPIERQESLGDARAGVLADKSIGERAGGMNYPVTSGGERVDTRFMRCPFKIGDQVRINPEASPEGAPRAGDPFPDKYETDAKGARRITSAWRRWSAVFPDQPESGGTFPRDVTWADLLRQARSDGVGTVKARPFLSKRGLWKLKVRVRGLTSNWGNGFYESELVAL